MSQVSLFKIDADKLDYRTWPTIDLDLLGPQTRTRTIKYREAIIALIDGSPQGAVLEKFNLQRTSLYRAVKRCIRLHPDGNVWGFRALIGYARQKCYQRKWGDPKAKKTVATGKFTQLLERYPAIKEQIVALFLKKTELVTVHESRIPIKTLHRTFLGRLKDAGVAQSEYPFDCKYCGYRAMGAFLKRVFEQNLVKAVKARHHRDVADQLSRNGAVVPPKEPPVPTMHRALADGHQLDCMMQVEMQSPQTGETLTVLLERPWLFLIFDYASRVILGYTLCLRPEYNEEDVLQAIENSLVPWQPRALTIPGLVYNPGAGFPSGIIPEMEYATWGEFWVDNAKAGLSKQVRSRIKQLTGSDINAGPVKMPERRALIERLFGSLERNGFQRLPSTTGSNPKDGRRDQPEAAVARFDIKLSEIEDLLDVLIANYNNSIHSSLHGRSPLEHLRHYLAGGGFVAKVPLDKRADLALFTLNLTATIRGSFKDGKRPYITFAGVTYHNDVLSHSPDLVGKKITIHVNLKDVRSVRAYFPDGAELGILTARSHWGVTPHDLRTRRAIMSLKHKGLIQYLHGEDPIQTYLDYLSLKAETRKGSRGKLIHIKRRMAAAKVAAPQTPPQTVAQPLVMVPAREVAAAPSESPRRTILY